MPHQLTAQDASYLYLETAETPMHVGSLTLVELPDGNRASFYDEYKATIASRLEHVPFMHSKLRHLPFNFDNPFWIREEHVDIDYHVRHLRAPTPGRMSELEDLVALLHATPLDQTRPLWEFYVIDGLESGQMALYIKVHHAAMDGASSHALVDAMYDPTPTPRTFPAPAADDDTSVVGDLLSHVVRRQLRAVRLVPELLKAWNNVFLPNEATLKLDPTPRTPRAPRTLFNVGITNQRAYAARTLPLSAFKALAKQTGTKVNDVVLAVCAGALRRYLQDKHALPEQPLVAMVPVAMHPGDTSTANQNAMFLCNLATDVADPVERLLAIHRSTAEQKRQVDSFKNIALPDFPLAAVGPVLRLLVERYGHREIREGAYLGNLTISNVPGAATPYYIAGARIASMFPCSIPFHGQALNMTVQGYCDRLDFGLIACRRAVPDVRLLADGLLESLADLQEAVAQPRKAVELEASPTIH